MGPRRCRPRACDPGGRDDVVGQRRPGGRSALAGGPADRTAARRVVRNRAGGEPAAHRSGLVEEPGGLGRPRFVVAVGRRNDKHAGAGAGGRPGGGYVPGALVGRALRGRAAGAPGEAWVFAASGGGLVTEVDPRPISPGRQRLLREAEASLAEGWLIVGGGA